MPVKYFTHVQPFNTRWSVSLSSAGLRDETVFAQLRCQSPATRTGHDSAARQTVNINLPNNNKNNNNNNNNNEVLLLMARYAGKTSKAANDI